MHEMGVAAEITRIAVEQADRVGAGAVVSVKLRVGEWSGVETQSLHFALEALSDGTRLEGCIFEIERVVPLFRCGSCTDTYAANGYFDPCPHCGAYGGVLEQGDELILVQLEVEET